MYENMIERLRQIAVKIKGDEPVDFTSVPFTPVLQMVMQGRNDTSKKLLNENVQVILQCITSNGDRKALGSLLELLCVLLEDADLLLASNESLNKLASQESFQAFCLDKAIAKMPEYQYYKNKERLENYYHTHLRENQLPFDGKGVVYTVVTGGYDAPKKPLIQNAEWDYYVFTDDANMAVEGWEIRLLEQDELLDMTRLARKHKILCHEYLKDYDYSIYIDGNIQIIGDLREYITKNSTGESALCIGHYITDDLYEEASLCKRTRKDDPEIIDAQIEKYRTEGFPEHYGMTLTGLLVRNHHDRKLKKTMEDWWNEVCCCSRRDQLSYTYACWKNEFLYDISPILLLHNPYIVAEAHG